MRENAQPIPAAQMPRMMRVVIDIDVVLSG